MKITKFLLIVLLIFFPFGEVLRFDLGNNIFLKPLDAISLVLLIWTLILYVKNKKFQKSLHLWYFYFPIIGIVSLLINSYWLNPHQLLTSFLYSLRWISYLSVFFAVIQLDEKFREKVKKFLIIDGLIIVIIGYFQFFLYPNLRNLYYLGWDEHLYRMFSTFLDPNFVGTFFVLYFIFICGLFFQKTKELQKKTVIFYVSVIILTVVAVFLTYSRSALIMLVISGFTLFLLLKKRKFMLYLGGAIIAFIIIISPYFYIENLDLFRVNSSISRFTTAERAIQIIQHNPLIGVGFDSYRYAQIKYHFISSEPLYQAHSASGDDTSLLFVFATTGIIGFVAYLYLWFRLYKKANNNKKNIYSLIFISSAIGLFINSLFINSLFYSEIMFWLWCMTGFMEKKE
jgi:O-antigen ligase